MPWCSWTTRSPGCSCTRSTALRRRAGIFTASRIEVPRCPVRSCSVSSARPTPGKAKPASRLPWVTWVSRGSGAEVGLGELFGGALRGAGTGEGHHHPPAVAGPGAQLLNRARDVAGEALDGRRVEGDVGVVVLALQRE